jgi:hypothetical protein
MPSKPSLQACAKDGRAVALDVFVVLDARGGDVPHQVLEPAPALLPALNPQVDAAQSAISLANRFPSGMSTSHPAPAPITNTVGM